MKPIHFFIYVSFCSIYGCAQTAGKSSFTEKSLVVGSKQTIEIKEIDLSITNNGCGRKWVSEADKPSFERPFCDLNFVYKNQSFQAGRNFDTVRHQDLLVVVQRMNPWGREEDSIPPGGCRLWVKQLR